MGRGPGIARASSRVTRPLLELDHLGYGFADASPRQAIDDITFAADGGSFVCIVGASGTGKTTLLRCVAGLLRPTSGRVMLRGELVEAVPEDVAFVFQEYGRSLFGWLTVAQNVELPLLRRRLTRADRDERVEKALGEVGLGAERARYPWQLSGGMQQRVAIARAFAYQPSLLLMDEPFGSVDAQTRADLQDLILAVWRRHGATILLVTHDIDESVYLGDRVIVLSGQPGRMEDDIVVDLPARDQIETRRSPRFVEVRADVARRIRRGPQPGASTSDGTSSPPSASPKSTR
jgi:NitT/TauT family transport system ATP-binding protein